MSGVPVADVREIEGGRANPTLETISVLARPLQNAWVIVPGEWRERITVDPAVLVGKPVVRGTRIAVEHMQGIVADGWTVEQVLAGYPGSPSKSLKPACRGPPRQLNLGSSHWLGLSAFMSRQGRLPRIRLARWSRHATFRPVTPCQGSSLQASHPLSAYSESHSRSGGVESPNATAERYASQYLALRGAQTDFRASNAASTP